MCESSWSRWKSQEKQGNDQVVSVLEAVVVFIFFFFFQAEDGIRDLVRSRGLGDVYKRQRKS